MFWISLARGRGSGRPRRGIRGGRWGGMWRGRFGVSGSGDAVTPLESVTVFLWVVLAALSWLMLLVCLAVLLGRHR